MKRLIVLIVVLASCRSAPSIPPGMVSGASSGEAAVEAFLGAVRAGDLQAMSLVWGTAEGPAASQMDRPEMEKRVLIMQCFFNHDEARIVERLPANASGRDFIVELKKENLTRTPRFKTTTGPSDRWYVMDAEMQAVQDFCRNPPSSG